jgi:hypothetical protein
VGQSIAEVIGDARREHLRLIFQAPKSPRVQHAVAIALKFVAIRMRKFRVAPPSGLFGAETQVRERSIGGCRDHLFSRAGGGFAQRLNRRAAYRAAIGSQRFKQAARFARIGFADQLRQENGGLFLRHGGGQAWRRLAARPSWLRPSCLE